MDQIHDNWDEVEAVSMAMELSDPNQPYSCATWGNQFNQVVDFMRNNNYNHTSLKLYTNSIKIQNLWLLLGNKYLVS